VIVVISLPCWLGQAISWISPSTGERWKLTEKAESVDSTYYGDIRGEVRWDTFTLWTMPLAGLLLVLGNDAWAYVGLVAGGMYTYFGGRGIATRRAITQRGGRIGAANDLRVAYAALTLWGALGLLAIVVSVAELVRT
jgi:hypothetical protein